MTIVYLGLKAVGWDLMTRGWWERTLGAILLGTVVIGLSWIVYRVVVAIQRSFARSRSQPKHTAAIEKHLVKLAADTKPILSNTTSSSGLKEFGAYLGSISGDSLPAVSQLLSKWDICILDPLATGVTEGLKLCRDLPSQRLGRVSIQAFAGGAPPGSADQIKTILDQLTSTIKTRFGAPSQYTAVLLADFQEYLPAHHITAVAKFIGTFGLDVWLELSPPTYLSREEIERINIAKISGVVYRNSTIQRDGQRRDFHQMQALRTTQRAIAFQKVKNPPVGLEWVTLDDASDINYAYVKRCYDWCSFNSMIPYVSRESALYNVQVAASKDAAIHAKPLGALIFLKNDTNLQAHNFWRENDEIQSGSCGHEPLFSRLDDYIPELSSKLQLQASSNVAAARDSVVDTFSALGPAVKTGLNPLAYSTDGYSFSGLGCFQLGHEVDRKAFGTILGTQSSLKQLNLLRRLEGDELSKIEDQIRAILEVDISVKRHTRLVTGTREFLTLLNTEADDYNTNIQIYTGLHSGFQHNGCHYYGIYDVDASSGHLNIYISNKCPDRAATVLHTFLSSRNYSRQECLLAEMVMAEQMSALNSKWQLPSSIADQIDKMSPTELILLNRRIVMIGFDNDVLLSRIQAYVEYHLMDLPTLSQLRTMASHEYLSGLTSPEMIVSKRLEWLQAKGCSTPDRMSAIQVFKDMDRILYVMLMHGNLGLYTLLGEFVATCCQPGKVDAMVDIFALSLFCALRKLGLEECEVEVLDRNPFPNHNTDQAGVLAENFGVGSRCEWFFDCTARHVGRILSARYRKYYKEFQPPRRELFVTDLPTTYAAMQSDNDPTGAREVLSTTYRITFLGIFAVPALIDITMLTTVGRGLYLTVFMTDTQKHMATTALLIALVTTGAIGSWISSGGSYYLYANAYSAMTMFIFTRYAAGMALILVVGLSCMIGFMCTVNVVAGLIFFYYYAVLTVYLLTLAALAIYQVPGSSFLSGRSVIMCVIPILFISPVLTIFVQHDIIVYVSVLGFFVTCLVVSARQTVAKWNTFYLGVPRVSDQVVLQWYETSNGGGNIANKSAEELEDLATQSLAQQAISTAVFKEVNKSWWQRKTKDELVLSLAQKYPTTRFIMAWYCNFKHSDMPLPYSPTWNLALGAALEMMSNMQKGLKLHSAFLHWRRTGDDILSGLLYFVVALMDKWVSLLTGGSLVGLGSGSSAQFRLAVGFGLSYYLVGAVCLDYVSQPLWGHAVEKTKQPITSLDFLRQASKNDTISRQRIYWTNLLKFFCIHIWGLAYTTALMWSFENDQDGTIIYVSYVAAYTGLLWYQYNKIYCGVKSSTALVLGAVIGLPIGCSLHVVYPLWLFSGVVALGSATWTAGVYSAWVSGIGWVFWKDLRQTSELSKKEEHDSSYSGSTLEPYPHFAQTTWATKYYKFSQGEFDDDRFDLDLEKHPGIKVKEIFTDSIGRQYSKDIAAAFPQSDKILKSVLEHWTGGRTLVTLVSTPRTVTEDRQIRAISSYSNGFLHVVVNLNRNGSLVNVSHDNMIIAEALIQATCEHHLGMSHDDAVLAELLVGDTEDQVCIPCGVQRCIESDPLERARVLHQASATELRHSLLGVRAEQEWDLLPKSIRKSLLARSCGISPDLSSEEQTWLSSRQFTENVLGRSALHLQLVRAIHEAVQHIEAHDGFSRNSIDTTSPDLAMKELSVEEKVPIKHPWYTKAVSAINTTIKFTCIALTADPEYQRELDYVSRDLPKFLRRPCTLVLNGVWCFCKSLQQWILPIFLIYGRESVEKINRTMRQTTTTVKKDRLDCERVTGRTTCFLKPQSEGELQMFEYAGQFEKEPDNRKSLVAINTYSSSMALLKREVYKNFELQASYYYDYNEEVKPWFSRNRVELPISRSCFLPNGNIHTDYYDARGFVTEGSYQDGDNPVTFTLWYRKNAKYEDELLRGEYRFPHITIRVTWAMPGHHYNRLDEWIPFYRVSEATFIEGDNTYHSSWTYEHRLHPEVQTTCNGELVETPAMISEDWFHVLKKPMSNSFTADNPLLNYSSMQGSFVFRWLGLNKMHAPVPVSYARTQLWKAWKAGGLDAVTARWLDEKTVRKDKTMKPYWRARDWGMLDKARAYLDVHADTIMARTDIEGDIAIWVHIAFKIGDYYSFGQGGDATINTRSQATQIRDTDNELHVIAMDTSTWPGEPGGVSACRRDMVNDLKTTKWHMIAESANDYGVPRFQIEKNVQSLSILPLWGLDFLTPTHGLLENYLDAQVVERSLETLDNDIRDNFLPILRVLVRCSRTNQLDLTHIDEATRALCDLNTYFEHSRNWNDVWGCKIVKREWYKLWLSDVDGALNIEDWWEFELPTIQKLDEALNLWHRYLFIFSIPIPAKIPDIFQASHHFTGAMFGIVCKVKRQCALHIWDHCISYREFATFMASAVSFDDSFVNSTLQSLTHMACVMLEHHADVVLPCCDWFNPGWEQELGTAEGVLEHRKTFARKIDPVVNGISNMERYKPVEVVKTNKPTVVMLSHVQFVKDLKNAIMACDIIVNKWGFKDYQLHMYGDRERASGLATELQEIIEAKKLSKNCILKGLGKPDVVLQDAWLFLNSSYSEGLPLAMGEAALAGVPVVCTDVGSSYSVVTDAATGARFSEVVPPNDSEMLARAQINILAVLGQWAERVPGAMDDPVPELGYPHPSPEQVEAITDRMMNKTELRRALGAFGRENVLKNFSADRYLREHEQMLWVGKYQSKSYSTRSSTPSSRIATPISNAVYMDRDVQISRPGSAASSIKNPRLTPESWISLTEAAENSSRDSLYSRLAKTIRAPSSLRRGWTDSSFDLRASDEESRYGGSATPYSQGAITPYSCSTPGLSMGPSTMSSLRSSPVYGMTPRPASAGSLAPVQVGHKKNKSAGGGSIHVLEPFVQIRGQSPERGSLYKYNRSTTPMKLAPALRQLPQIDDLGAVFR